MTVTVIDEFSTENPYSTDKLNANFRALVGAINSLAGTEVVQFGATGNTGSGYVPVSGGAFLGQISAPSVLIGPTDGPKNNAVTTGDFATQAQGGVVLLAAQVAELTQAISNPPTQAEVQAVQDKVNALLQALTNAKQMA